MQTSHPCGVGASGVPPYCRSLPVVAATVETSMFVLDLDHIGCKFAGALNDEPSQYNLRAHVF